MKQRKSEERHRHPWHFPKLGHRLCCLLSWLCEILSSVEYILVLLPTGDVSSYRFPSGSGGFFVFSIASRGPRGEVSSSLSVMTAVLLAASFQSTLTLPSLLYPCPIPWQILAAMHFTALLILTVFGLWYLLFRDAGTWNPSPVHLGPAMASVASSLWQWFCLERQAPKQWSEIPHFGMWCESPGLALWETWAVFSFFSFSLSLADWTFKSKC